MSNEPDMSLLIKMLKYRRPSNGVTQKIFNDKFLKPVFGEPDQFNNYMLVIGKNPNICFTAHHDTVHYQEGMQNIMITEGMVYLHPESQSNCLGADCTTGIWLILHMIKNNVPGRYIIFSEEESGGEGSLKSLIKNRDGWVKDTDIMISLDRRGRDSVVTHQFGERTCSDDFALELSSLLGGEYFPDDTGVFTDSYIFKDHIPECTNISVGYDFQHTKRETQDLDFARVLADSLVQIEFKNLPIIRTVRYDAPVIPYQRFNYYGGGVDEEEENHYLYGTGSLFTLEDMCDYYPKTAAAILKSYGITVDDFSEYLSTRDRESIKW